jgi:hypothetical protein
LVDGERTKDSLFLEFAKAFFYNYPYRATFNMIQRRRLRKKSHNIFLWGIIFYYFLFFIYLLSSYNTFMAKITVKALNKISTVGPNLRDLTIVQGIIKLLLNLIKMWHLPQSVDNTKNRRRQWYSIGFRPGCWFLPVAGQLRLWLLMVTSINF